MTVPQSEFGKADRTFSNQCGCTLMNNQAGHDVAAVMRKKENVTVRELPSMIRVDAIEAMEFGFDELTDAVGYEFGASDFEEIMSTHYGRMVVLDDRVAFFSSPEAAAEYIGFDLKPIDQ